ncbi:PucR family transcriptional regulator [uncultured Roseobacter sp.]|uniref:PucR family transcriptional regulator n=1 Tax=uncultured Roseobacter sp. TaxID=114847 RepID=UPI00260A65C3|nr:PucR family transcriptional regulator [uncultured Roseobacter sp.]
MTQVITRYFDSVEQARLVRQELVYRRRFNQKILRLYEDAKGAADALVAADVAAETAEAYQKRLAKGGAVLMVRAGFKPLSVAQTARNVTAAMGAVDLGDLVEEVYVKDALKPSLSILQDHPLMFTRPRDPYATNFHMADWPIPLISRRKPFAEMLFPPHARMADFPIPLISRRKPYTGSAIQPHARMANFPIPLISRREPFTGSIFPRHARMANFPIPLISRRKPYTGSLIPRHQRMANWPFPHLINGKTGTNSLIPGGPRMANFPISLLSGRKPFDKSIFKRHARMASFPISLISRRKPFTGSMFPRHARMADVLLPLVIKHGDGAPRNANKGFSFSKFFGLPTLIKR